MKIVPKSDLKLLDFSDLNNLFGSENPKSFVGNHPSKIP